MSEKKLRVKYIVELPDELISHQKDESGLNCCEMVVMAWNTRSGEMRILRPQIVEIEGDEQ